MTAKELAEQLTAIAEAAPVLRAAGVLGRVEIHGVAFEVCEPVTPDAQAQAAPQSVDPLDDPDLFGGQLPQRKRREEPAQTEVDDE